MKIHEYQAKELFREYGIIAPNGYLVDNVQSAIEVSEALGFPCVIKAQVHSGARGKAGGIKLAKNTDEFKQYANDIIGMKLKSIQTGDEPKLVRKVLIEEGINIDKELYIAFTVNRKTEKITLIASTEGGMDIEAVAEQTPEKILKADIDLQEGFTDEILDSVADLLGCECIETIIRLYNLFIQKDCALVEVNPLVITKSKEVIAVDGKVNFDENALYKHPEILELRDTDEENPLELEASKFDLNYIKLDGSIGCMVNGAGLAMATMDLIKLSGKSPANFLDVGGGASSENIENAFRILLSDKNVEAILINIFGGILRCDVLAEGIKNAVQKLNIDLPVIIRIEGTNKEQGAKILKESGLKFTIAKDLDAITLALKEL